METKLKNSDNPRYSKDENGQWWYRTLGPKKLPRIRAGVRVCERCGCPFLGHARTQNASSRSKGNFCGIQCANASIKPEFRGTCRGPKHKSWKGGKRKNEEGYVQIWTCDHPHRNKNNYVYEHRLVMEKMLGRYLFKGETVHHKNGIRSDNRPENLELWVKSQPAGQRAADLLDYARWVLATYGPIEPKLAA